MTAAEFDRAVAALRRVVVGGEALPPLAHAAGRPTVHFAADLHAFVQALHRAIHVAKRTEGKVFRIGARGDPEEVVELPPGWTLNPRPDRPPAPVRTEAQVGPREIGLTARGDLADPDALPPGYRMVSQGEQS